MDCCRYERRLAALKEQHATELRLQQLSIEEAHALRLKHVHSQLKAECEVQSRDVSAGGGARGESGDLTCIVLDCLQRVLHCVVQLSQYMTCAPVSSQDEYRKRQQELDAMFDHKIQNLSRDKEQKYITELQKVCADFTISHTCCDCLYRSLRRTTR